MINNNSMNIWMQMLGFEMNDPDRGVKRYLDNLGFIPESICAYNVIVPSWWSITMYSPYDLYFPFGLLNAVDVTTVPDFTAAIGVPALHAKSTPVWPL